MNNEEALTWGGLLLAALGMIEIIRSLFWWWRARNWASSEATIISEKESLFVNPAFLGGGPIQGGAGRVHKVRYRYTVNGKEFTGWRVTPHDIFGFSDLRYFPEIKLLLDDKNKHRPITVLYSKKNPKLSLICRRISLGFFLAYLGAVILGVFFFLVQQLLRH